MSGRVAVIDYGMGNLLSVMNALNRVGVQAELVNDPDRVAEFDRVILPGVGAFAEAIAHLRHSGMDAALSDFVGGGRPLLGVCLGMQLICSRSEEGGEHQGLGWIKADVRRFDGGAGLKVPHMGWNSIDIVQPHPVLAGLEAGADAYFVHSYRVIPNDPSDVLATTDYGGPFASIIGRGHVIGMQFHPEKSQDVGLRLLDNFSRL